MDFKIPVHSCRNISIPVDFSTIPSGIESFQSHSGGFRSHSGGFRSHSGGIQRNPVIPAGICGASKSTALSWDRLHAYHGGLFSDHLLVELKRIVDNMGRQSHAQIDDQ